MNNNITFSIKNIDDVKNLISIKYGTLKNFCIKNSLNYHSIHLVINKRNFKHKHIKKICQILNLDIEQIEVWRDV